jgi:hypothetical protein
MPGQLASMLPIDSLGVSRGIRDNHPDSQSRLCFTDEPDEMTGDKTKPALNLYIADGATLVLNGSPVLSVVLTCPSSVGHEVRAGQRE